MKMTSIGSVLTLIFPAFLGCQSAQAGTSVETSRPPGPEQHAQVHDAVTPEGAAPEHTVDDEQVAIARAFDAQPFDDSWRTAREARLQTAFKQLKGNISLESAECRQTLCKVVVRLGGGRTTSVRQAITGAFDDNDGFLREHSFVVYGSADRSQSTIYVSRNHYRLPDMNGFVAEIPIKPGTP